MHKPGSGAQMNPIALLVSRSRVPDLFAIAWLARPVTGLPNGKSRPGQRTVSCHLEEEETEESYEEEGEEEEEEVICLAMAITTNQDQNLF